MSGRYQIHTGLQHRVILNGQPHGLPLSNLILPGNFVFFYHLRKKRFRSELVKLDSIQILNII